MSDLFDLVECQVVHLDCFVCLVENHWPITASNHGHALLCLEPSHPGVDGAHVAYLCAPQRSDCVVRDPAVIWDAVLLDVESSLHELVVVEVRRVLNGVV